jgi:TldD protein
MDEAFLAIPSQRLADAALSRARQLGAQIASCRIERIRTGRLLLRDRVVQGSQDTVDIGLAVRVVHDGTSGFAATAELTAEAAAATAARAITIARACAGVNTRPVELADEPVHRDATWISDYQINPFELPERDRVALLAGWSDRLLSAPTVAHVLAKLTAVQENKFYADLSGTVTTQQRIRVHPQVLALGVDKDSGTTQTLRSLGPPSARGWEYLTNTGWDWDAELAEIPDQLAGKLRARPVEPGNYDLVIDASNLWLTIHESVGHATELDRALGYEASYAGGTFATLDLLGSMRYGSPLMTVTADRRTAHGLATIGYDDEGVAAQSWQLVENGVLVGFQLDRHTARTARADRSNGCAFAESGTHVPLARMPNVSLRPAPDGPSTEEIIADVQDGIFLVGSDSWSIDMLRRNFQFTAQRCHRIHNGRLDGQLSGVAYQADTVDFWSALRGLGGAQTYRTFGADLCGKGQPVQAAPVSHGCPTALFRQIRVLNTGRDAAS